MVPVWPSKQLIKNVINKTTVKPATAQQISHKVQIKDVITKQPLLKRQFSSFICVFAKHGYEHGAVLYPGTLPGNDLGSMQGSLQGAVAAGIDGIWALSPSWLAGGETRRLQRKNEEGLSPSVVVTYYTATCVRGRSITVLQCMEGIK